MQSDFIPRMLNWITYQLGIELKLIFDLSCSIRMVTELEHIFGIVYSTHIFESSINLLSLCNIEWIDDKNTILVVYLIKNLFNKRLVLKIRCLIVF